MIVVFTATFGIIGSIAFGEALEPSESTSLFKNMDPIPSEETHPDDLDHIIRHAIDNLKSDDVDHNALHAIDKLREIGFPAVPWLENALYSEDYQTRHAAACLLCEAGHDYQPSDKLIQVVLESLEIDKCPSDLFGYFIVQPSSGCNWFIDNPEYAEKAKRQLIANLHSNDKYARFFSALILANWQETDLTSLLAPILLPHLCDNRIPRDATAAAHALYKLGDGVRPFIEPLIEGSDDEQQAELARMIVVQLDNPDESSNPTTMREIDTRVHNPIIERGKFWWRWDYRDRFPDENGKYPWQVRPALLTPPPN